MIGFVDSFAVWAPATILPAFLGLFLIVWAGSLIKPRYTAAFALGIFLWFFVDTIGPSAGLDVNDGFAGGAAQLGVVSLFIAGLLVFVLADRNRSIFDAESVVGKYGIIIPILVAVAVGVHGLGEGAAYAALTSTTPSTSIIDAFGGVSAGVAYVLHKGLEPMMIGACYSVYSKDGNAKFSARLADLAALSLVFSVPSLFGAATGYFIGYNTSYFFALGTGTSIYAALRLASPIFSTRDPLNPRDSSKLAVALLLGFMAIYFAALFHS